MVAWPSITQPRQVGITNILSTHAFFYPDYSVFLLFTKMAVVHKLLV